MQQASSSSAPAKSDEKSGVALCLALGGSSDIIGVGALAKAAGYSRMVIIQPGSAAKGLPPTKEVGYDTVEPKTVAPGGGFFDNGSMVAYLLSAVPEAEAGYYLTQPKDDGVGFSEASFTATIDAIVHLAEQHACVAIVGLDFGGDASLDIHAPSKEGSVPPFILERDRLNLRAARCAAARLSLPQILVAASPGIDAAAVAPNYAERLQQAADGRPVRVLELGEDGALHELSTPAPECALPVLPGTLFQVRALSSALAFSTGQCSEPRGTHHAACLPRRICLASSNLSQHGSHEGVCLATSAPATLSSRPPRPQARRHELEAKFMRVLRPLAARILSECPEEKCKARRHLPPAHWPRGTRSHVCHLTLLVACRHSFVRCVTSRRLRAVPRCAQHCSIPTRLPPCSSAPEHLTKTLDAPHALHTLRSHIKSHT